MKMVIPRRLSSNFRRFGTHCRFHLHRQVDEVYFIHLPMKMVIPRRLSSNFRRFGTHCRFHLHRQADEVYFIHLPMKMEPTVSSETSAIRIQTPGNYPKRNKLHLIFSLNIPKAHFFKTKLEFRITVGIVKRPVFTAGWFVLNWSDYNPITSNDMVTRKWGRTLKTAVIQTSFAI